MSGNWTPNPGPSRAGVYINTETVGTSAAAGGAFGTVAMPITAHWGPIGETVSITSDEQLGFVYGYDEGAASTVTTHLVREALIGGAKEVLVRRIADGTEAAAELILEDVTGTPRDAITLTALYEGERGNDLTVTVQANPLDNTKKDLIIYENGILREKWTHVAIEMVNLVAAINDTTTGSRYVSATLDVAGPYVALANITGVALTTGNSGETPIAADYTAAIEAFQREGGFDIFVLDGVDDDAIITSLVAWVAEQNAAGNYVFTVVGGPAAESVSSAVTRSGDYGSEFVAALYGDVEVTLTSGAVVDWSSAQLAPRVAGMIAAAGVTGSITRGQLPGVKIATPLTDIEVDTLKGLGLITLARRGTVAIIEDGITSFIDFSDEKDQTYGTISNVRAIQQISIDLNETIESNWIGQKKNTFAARAALVTDVTQYLKGYEAIDVLAGGSTVEVDERYDNDRYNLHLLLNVQFGRELKRVLITLRAPTIN